jgi:uncharacterized membrane protein
MKGQAMLSYAITSVTGWLMMVLLVAIIAYPFLLRAGFLGPVQPFLLRMRLHYWLGYTVGCALLVHIWFSMSGGLALSVNTSGLYLGTVAMVLLGVQIALGRRLSWPKLPKRRLMRRWHCWVMLGLVAFILGHVVLDSAMFQVLLAR